MSRPNAVTKKKPAAPRAKRAAKPKKGAAPPTDRAAPRPAGPKAGKVLKADTIRARCIEIIDCKGRTVIEIGTYRGAGAICIGGPGGRDLAVIGPNLNPLAAGGGCMMLMGPKNEMAVTLAGDRQGGQVTVLDADGNAQARLAAFDLQAVGGAILNIRGRDRFIEAHNGRVQSMPLRPIDAPMHPQPARPGTRHFGKWFESAIW